MRQSRWHQQPLFATIDRYSLIEYPLDYRPRHRISESLAVV